MQHTVSHEQINAVKVEKLDVLVLASKQNDQVHLQLFKLSEIEWENGSPKNLSTPLYIATVHQDRTVTSKANTNVKGTKFEHVIQYVEKVLNP
ncbi:hypothetical protein [Bacillus coahuilensis]|uniref:hypothetical protein n=1 Tax=Bacillus coahuilensis TaxID=408580 RepID=UPI0001850DB7|nr:hypothetical protein [Bacillus coahuilensis]